MLLREGVSLAARLAHGFGALGERGPRDGPPVMVIPGFGASDRGTLRLQRALAAAGYRVTGWGQGFNRGARGDTRERIASALEAFGQGRKVILIGWSLGGVFARETAKLRPDLVAGAVTLGAPFSGGMRANNAWWLYERIAGHPVDRPPVPIEPGTRPPVPTIAFWSRRDGMVAPASARGAPHESDRRIELDCTHMGFAVSARAYPAIIAALDDLVGRPAPIWVRMKA
jgi:pimeloyl-ACP methyl ester carboxylesterase